METLLLKRKWELMFLFLPCATEKEKLPFS